MTRRFRVDGEPSSDEIAEIASVLRSGGVAILPTDTIYGFHAMAGDEGAVARIFAIKRRSAAQPLVVVAGSVDDLAPLGVTARPEVLAALARLWPAPLTAILPLRRPIAASSGRDTIAIRIPDLAWMRELARRTGALASTSVNLSGERAVYSTEDVTDELIFSVDLVVDAGRLEGAPSTLVDFTGDEPRVVREGRFVFTQNLWKTVWKTL